MVETMGMKRMMERMRMTEGRRIIMAARLKKTTKRKRRVTTPPRI